MIDFHCHLDLYPDPEVVAARCEKQGLYVLSVTTTPSAWRGTRALERGRIRTALGLHPQLAHERRSELAAFDRFLPEARYVGEIGLDGSPESKGQWRDQLTVFRHILSSCGNAGGRIMSIHSRRASRAVLDELAARPDAGIAVLHWFSGSFRDLARAIEIGCWFSVGPAMLVSERGRALAARMPRDRILTESDGPFAHLAGSAAMPWDTETAVQTLAALWGLDERTIRAVLIENLNSLTRGDQDPNVGAGRRRA